MFYQILQNYKLTKNLSFTCIFRHYVDHVFRLHDLKQKKCFLIFYLYLTYNKS